MGCAKLHTLHLGLQDDTVMTMKLQTVQEDKGKMRN
jgi:hypothetical protein